MSSDILTVRQYGRELRMRDRPGRIGAQWRKGRMYEQKFLDHLYALVGREELAARGGVAVDAGANFGNHTLFFALVCGFERVVAFEPLTLVELWDTLELNMQETLTPGTFNHDGGRVETYGTALGEEAGGAYIESKGTLTQEGEGDAPIPVAPLDHLELENVRLFKLDIEDMEPQALRGARETIDRCRPIIFAECHDGQYGRQERVLEPLGYRSVGNVRSYRGAAPVIEWRHQG